MITVTMKKLLGCVQILTPLMTDKEIQKELPMTLRNKLAKVSVEIKEYEELRNEKVLHYGEEVEEVVKNDKGEVIKDEKGEDLKHKFYQVKKENMSKYIQEVEDMNNEEITIICNKVKNKELEKTNLTPMEIAFLMGWLVENSEEES